MTFEFNGNLYSLPNTLDDITLGRYMEYMDMYGYDVAAQREAAEQYKNPDARDRLLHPDELALEESLSFLERLTKSFSFFSGIPLEEVQANISMQDLYNYMSTVEISMATEQTRIIVQPNYEFEGEVWEIQSPMDGVDPANLMHAEFAAVMRLGRLILELVKGDWRGASQLCAAYFRKEGEAFDPGYSEPGSEREVLMREQLPLSIALAVIEYLRSSMQLFQELIDTHVPTEEQPLEP